MWCCRNENLNEFYKKYKLFILRLCVHLLLLTGLIEAYFGKSMEDGMVPVKATNQSITNRIVIFVVDSLSTQIIYNKEGEENTPFITNIRRHRGSWGIAHAKPPTETRVGHLALIAGVDEDPSLVFNAFNYYFERSDTVLNRTDHVWLITSCQIIRFLRHFLFGRPVNVYGRKYSRNFTSYINKNGKNLSISLADSDVFENFQDLIKENVKKPKLYLPKSAFLFSFGGLDSIGHKFTINTEKHKNNVNFLDETLEKIEKICNETFKDGKTTFILTSDHGMNMRSHGGGSDLETFTPFITWGEGIKIENKQKDIRQKDVAPFIAALLGLHFPIVSIGKLPLNYLNITKNEELKIFLRNILQIYRILEIKQKRITVRSYLCKEGMSKEYFDHEFSKLWNATNGSFNDGILRESEIFLDSIFKLMENLQNCMAVNIMVPLSFGYFLWVFYFMTNLMTNVNEDVIRDENEKNTRNVEMLILIYNTLIILSIFWKSFSFIYSSYYLFPSFMFYLLIKGRAKISQLFSFKVDVIQFYQILHFFIWMIILIFSLAKRNFLSFTILAICTSIFFEKEIFVKISKRLLCFWIGFSSILTIFPFLPMKISQFNFNFMPFVTLGFSINLLITSLSYSIRKFDGKLFIYQKIFSFICMIFLFNFLNNLIVPNLFVVTAVIFLAFIPPFFINHENDDEYKFFSMFIAVEPFFIIASLSYDLTFLTIFTNFLLLWIDIEKLLNSSSLFSIYRKCFMFVSLLIVSFHMLTGALLWWEIRDIAVNGPKFLEFLYDYSGNIIEIKFKLLIFFSTCAFKMIVYKTKMSIFQCFLIISLIFDVILIFFMFNIKNCGSWARIGGSVKIVINIEIALIYISINYYISTLLFNYNKLTKPKFIQKIESCVGL